MSDTETTDITDTTPTSEAPGDDTAAPTEPDEIVAASDDDVLTADGEVHATDVDPALAAGESDAEGGEPTAVDDDGGPDPAIDAEHVTTEDELLAEPVVIDNPYTRPGRWFVVHNQSGYEKKV